ncbi:transposase family protein [Actinophytocola sp.]|uniref:transposase family protein n=1 Tax=Actinophytocola sp. TaxID=1872138 RepID=UPI00389AA56D
MTPEARGGLLEVLESVPDPRKKRGVRHRFSAILFVSVCAVVSGAHSFAAIAEWAADAVEGTGLKGEFWPRLGMWFGSMGLIVELVPGSSGRTKVIGGGCRRC